MKKINRKKTIKKNKELKNKARLEENKTKNITRQGKKTKLGRKNTNNPTEQGKNNTNEQTNKARQDTKQTKPSRN